MIFPIWHEDDNGNLEQDGTGFVLDLIGTNVFVTCKHVIQGQSGKVHFIEHQGARIVLDESSCRYFESTKTPMPECDGEWYKMEVEDYAFYALDEIEEVGLGVKSTLEVSTSDQLTFITHDNTGARIVRSCARKDQLEYVDLHLTGMHEIVHGTNLIYVDITGLEKGHSGGPVIDDETGHVIGFLKGASRYRNSATHDTPFIIKGQTIFPKYLELTEANKASSFWS